MNIDRLGARQRRAILCFCFLLLGFFPAADTLATTGAVTLIWHPPLENTNGSTLQDLAGYKIYHGTRSESLQLLITLKNPGLSSYVVESLPSGTHYFAISSFNKEGVESTPTQLMHERID